MDTVTERPPLPAHERIASISRQIWEDKYRLKAADGTPLDLTIEDTWRRVARALAAVERQPELWEARFYAALEDFRFLPAGRIVSGAGTERRVTLFNCFVMGDIADDLGSIFANLREAALTMQQGGGIGYDFSTLRPKGAAVRGVAADASGPLSFMDVWDAMCRTIMSAGARRGAMMATMRCDHPDIEAFIAAKREPGRLRNFNLSVLVTDAFMAAIDADAEWPLVFAGVTYRTVRVRALWDAIMRATYDYAEPGVLFIDRINARNNLWYCETIRSTNPCAEQPLPAYGACLLGSVNLARLVRDPFTPAAHLDEAQLADLVGVAVRMLDDTIDASGFPLEEQRREAVAKRRIGLGLTGLADALMMVGLRYGSPEAAAAAGRWMELVNHAAYIASAHLAAEKGAFPLFDREPYLAGETVRGLDLAVQALIAEKGIRKRAADFDRADRDHLAAGRQRVVGRRAGVRACVHPQGAAAGRQPARGGGRGLRGAALPRPVRRRRRAARALRHRADAHAGRARAHAGGAATARGQRHLQDGQRPRGHCLRGVPEGLSRRLPERVQRLHHLPAERDHRLRPGHHARARLGAGRIARPGRRVVGARAASPPSEAGRQHLQAALGGQRARALRHDQ